MTYEEARRQIRERMRFGSKLTLDRIRELLHRLGRPDERLNAIHIAGTNGKGSVAKFVYHALLAQGYRVGLYTSPYVVDFRERIECDGAWIDRESFAGLADRALRIVCEMEAEGHDAPTEFEVITAIAFLYYAQRECDYVVVEVGLGGRGDATNVLERPLLSIITSIGLDHTQQLGSSLAEVAAEKAGIIKEGCPVVSCVSDENARAVIRRKADVSKSLLHDVLSEIAHCDLREQTLAGSEFSVTWRGGAIDTVRIALPGRYQVDNAVTALCALRVLRNDCGVALEEEAVRRGFLAARHPGRMEVLDTSPLILIDGAHNADGMQAFVQSIRPLIRDKKTLLTIGLLKDKDVDRMLDFAVSLGARIAVSEPDNPRKMNASELKKLLQQRGIDAEEVGEAADALRRSLALDVEADAYVFVGSLYFISSVREQFFRAGQGKEQS